MLFEVIDKRGKRIRLTESGLSHIKRDHPDVDIDEIRLTLEMPTKITTSEYDENVKWYYRFNKNLREYLLVAVKYLNGDAFIITSYYTKKIK